MSTTCPVAIPTDDALRQSEERHRLISSLMADFADSFVLGDSDQLTRHGATEGCEKLGGGATDPVNGTRGPVTAGKGQHILVVEDEAALRDLAARLLRRGGYRVTTAATGAEAIAAAEAGPVALVFSDVVLPDLGGVDIVERLTQRGLGHIRFLFTSGYTDERSRWPWIQERGYPFIQKPYLMDNLLEAVQAILATPTPIRKPASDSPG